jgi:DNA-directed RNA polymerase specialized sigma subunit
MGNQVRRLTSSNPQKVQENKNLYDIWVAALHARNTSTEEGKERLQYKVDDAFAHLLEKNMGLVHAEVRKFDRIDSKISEDLAQAGCAGLIQAVKGTNKKTADVVTVNDDGTLRLASGWNPDRATLGTVARSHISGAIRREVNRLEKDGITYTTFQQQPQVKAAVDAMRDEGVSISVQDVARRAGVTEAVARQLTMGAPVSLSTPVGGDDTSRTLGDKMSDMAHDGELSDTQVDDLETQLVRHLRDHDTLSILDVMLAAVRHDLISFSPSTLSDTAQSCGMTRGAARIAMDRIDAVLADIPGIKSPQVQDM